MSNITRFAHDFHILIWNDLIAPHQASIVADLLGPGGDIAQVEAEAAHLRTLFIGFICPFDVLDILAAEDIGVGIIVERCLQHHMGVDPVFQRERLDGPWPHILQLRPGKGGDLVGRHVGDHIRRDDVKKLAERRDAVHGQQLVDDGLQDALLRA